MFPTYSYFSVRFAEVIVPKLYKSAISDTSLAPGGIHKKGCHKYFQGPGYDDNLLPPPSLVFVLSVYSVFSAPPAPITAHRPKVDNAHSMEDPPIVDMRERKFDGSLITDIQA